MRVLVALLALLVCAPMARAATISVNSNADTAANDGVCTLREALTAANTDTASGALLGECPAGAGADTIDLSSQTGTIAVGSLLPTLTTPVTIQGPGANVLAVSAGGASGIFTFNAGSNTTLTGLTVRDGNQTFGGAIQNRAPLLLEAVALIANQGTSAGAIYSEGTLTVRRSLLAQNSGGPAINTFATTDLINSTATGNTGSGIVSGSSSPTVTVTNSTLAQNALGAGVTLSGSGSTYTLRNSILANGVTECGGGVIGTAANTFTDDTSCGGTVADAKLAGLADNGGPTQTLALGAGSPAIDTGDDAVCAGAAGGVDQRGVIRPAGPHCDSGAFEAPVVAPPAPTPTAAPPTPTPVPTATPTPTPVPGKSVTIAPKTGSVTVRVPGSKAFVDLRQLRSIPLGAEVDATKGHVNLVPSATEHAEFWDGRFTVREAGGITRLILSEPLTCPRSHKAKKKTKRRLWGDGKGKFKTEGRYSSAVVKGTRWLVEDTCTSTRTQVSRGVVSVVPKHGRAKSVRAGHQLVIRG